MLFFSDFIGRFNREGIQEESVMQGTMLLNSQQMFIFQPRGPPRGPQTLLMHLLVSNSSFVHTSSFSMNFDWLPVYMCVCVRACVQCLSPSLHSQSLSLPITVLAEDSPQPRHSEKTRGFHPLIHTGICCTFNFII